MHATRHGVTLDEVRAEHFRQSTLRRAAPEVHLKQAVLSLDESLGEKEVGLVVGINVRHAPGVAHNPYRCGQSGHRQGTRDLRERRRRPCRALRSTARHADGQRHDSTKNGPAYTNVQMALKDAVLAEYDHEMGTTRKLLERLPDDKLSWKPHEKSMSLAGLATHLGQIPHWAAAILNEPSFELDGAALHIEAKTSRAEIVTAFDAVVQKTRPSLDKTDAEYQQMWSLTRGDREVFSMPRIAALRTFVLYHIVHHRGQLSVYLRLNDVPVPAIYGPTADEG